MTRTAHLSPQAFLTLLLVACLFGANHVAARIAIDHGVDVATAVAARSLGTALVVGLIVRAYRVPLAMTAPHKRAMPLIGVLVAAQSLCLYSAVARIPVGLALLAFNTYPLCTALAVWVLYGHRPEARVLIAMPVILVGLALALDVGGAASGMGARDAWSRMGAGVGLALAGSAIFGVVLAVTQHSVADLDGRLRTAITMAIVGVLALAATQLHGGLHWPDARAGWWGLVALTVLYGTAFTTVFTLLPRLGVVGNSPILNVEPVAAMGMAWLVLGQTIAPVQLVGAAIVVGTVMALGLRRRPAR
jgi:drug/metabolite transporter (DMT)-like permease